MPHLVLLGDSTFDNGAYVRGGPDVAAQCRTLLGADWRVTCLAADGAVIEDVPRQLAAAPPDATHVAMSVGGSNALAHAGILNRPVASSAEVLAELADARDAFAAAYDAALDALEARGLPFAVCTVYNGNLAGRAGRLAAVALAVFDDAILRAAAARRLCVVELRLVCDAPADYATPIEPSVVGGAKIARAVARAVEARGGPGAGGTARLFTA